MVGRLTEMLALGCILGALLLMVPMIFQKLSTADIETTKSIDRPIVRLAIPFDCEQLWVQKACSEIAVLNLDTKRAVYTYQQPGEMITDWQVSRDGKILMVVSDDRMLRIYQNNVLSITEDLFNRKPNHHSVALGAALSANGQMAIILSDFTAVSCWSVSSNEIHPSDFTLLNPAKRFAICPNGEKLIVSEERGTLREYDVKLGASVRTIAASTPASLDPMFSADGRSFAVVRGKSVSLYDSETGNADWAYKTSAAEEILSLAFSPDGTMLAVGGLTQEIQILDRASGQSRQRIVPQSSTHRLAFLRSNNNLYGGCLDGVVRVWSVPAGCEIAQLHPFQSSINSTR